MGTCFCDEGRAVELALNHACRSRRVRSTLAERRKLRMSGPLGTCDFMIGHRSYVNLRASAGEDRRVLM